MNTTEVMFSLHRQPFCISSIGEEERRWCGCRDLMEQVIEEKDRRPGAERDTVPLCFLRQKEEVSLMAMPGCRGRLCTWKRRVRGRHAGAVSPAGFRRGRGRGFSR